jgi:hypothetical protein
VHETSKKAQKDSAKALSIRKNHGVECTGFSTHASMRRGSSGCSACCRNPLLHLEKNERHEGDKEQEDAEGLQEISTVEQGISFLSYLMSNVGQTR